MNGWKILGGTLLAIGAIIVAPVILVSKACGAKGASDDDPSADDRLNNPSDPCNDYP